MGGSLTVPRLAYAGVLTTEYQDKQIDANESECTKLNGLAFSQRLFPLHGCFLGGRGVLNDLCLCEMMTFSIFKTFVLILCSLHESEVS